ncbi:MBOAT family protein [Metabacillus litoralis]|uniref:MBOAT family protein n=1 Tax=Metabacillus litoralis TaxID=152268 RepID=A0A5C6W3L5_9BACI|nr:MBOAT family O-acyltransferase [Metabacillus litoralis]TXC90952.1 MBOAT family protein [Metabacillus litoralis]
MVFSNLVFLFLFLPIVLTVYFISPHRLRNSILLIASLFFYAWGEPKYVALMLFSVFMNYLLGLLVEVATSKRRKKLILSLAVIGNLVMLGFFKYMNFLVANLNALFNLSIEMEPIPLPIGISFFTFQAMSYVIDVYRRDAPAQRNLLDLSLYIALFPQLIAGPIVRYNTVADQIKKRITSFSKFSEGVSRFILGLAKKVLIANPLGGVADEIFSMPAESLSTGTAWIGIIAYTLQIYFDFSGYSDMAIGLGKMFGFDFEENFNYPYISRSISEFWRRWHISLGTWFKDYLYIPLGGNRVSTFKIYRNLLIVWTITGFWHGASWTFMAWGFYYGIIISLEKLGLEKLIKSLWRPFQHLYVILIFIIGWVFFRADNFSYSFDYLRIMFGAGEVLISQETLLYMADYWIVLLLGVLFSMPIYPFISKAIQKFTMRNKGLQFVKDILSTFMYLVLMIVIAMYLVNSTYNPFIYFRF